MLKKWPHERVEARMAGFHFTLFFPFSFRSGWAPGREINELLDRLLCQSPLGTPFSTPFSVRWEAVVVGQRT